MNLANGVFSAGVSSLADASASWLVAAWSDVASNVTPWLWGQAEEGGNGGGILSLLGNPMVTVMVIGMLLYFMVMRPDSKKRAEQQQMLANLKKNDRVVTIGGLFGTVVNVQQDAEDVTLKIDEGNNTRIRILRSAIARVLKQDDSGEGGKAKKDE